MTILLDAPADTVSPDDSAPERTASYALDDTEAFAKHRAANLRPEVLERLTDIIEEKGVKYVYYVLPSIGSRAVGKVAPAAQIARNLEKGVCIHRIALTDLQADTSGKLLGDGEEALELWALPDPETFQVLPWDREVALVFCRAYEPPHLPEIGGRPLATDSRAHLFRMHSDFEARTGLELRSGCEPEMSWEADWLHVASKPGSNPAYAIENLERVRPIYAKVIEYATELGFTMIEGDYEDAGQIELNWMFDRAELTADRLFVYRLICKQVARELGVSASFMPKPYMGQMGNGCHHNVSLWENGTNILEDEGRTEIHLTERGRQALGGLLEHAPASAAVMASTFNSYKRFWDPGQTAPLNINWGFDNRACMVRVSSNGRLEYRIPDASVNPYLSHALILAAMDDGLERRLNPGEPQFGADANSAGEQLPATLGEALALFDGSAFVDRVLPETLREQFSEMKHDEWARYCQAVTDLDREMYWEAIP